MTNRKKSILVFALICLVIEIVIFLVPKNTSAAIIEPLYKVLNTQDQIKTVWNQVLGFINYLGAAVLIFIAFANILRININNYGVKKFLPTLILTIIAANFSYLICRLLIDLANVACDLLISGPGGSNSMPEISNSWSAFNFTSSEFNQIDITNFWTYLMFAIGEFIGGVMILILAFLFFIRNYVIYFLVVLAPIAFVSLSLPQTKSAFNQWWSNFWKWAFLPIVSLFWLWLAAQWAGSSLVPGATSVLGFVFAGVCYYLAITTPFKMGGTIMQQWGNLGKKAWGATGGKVVDYQKAKSAAVWGARMGYAQTRFKELTGIGTGLDIAKEKQNRAQRYGKAATDQIIGDWKKRNPVKEGLWEQRLQSMEGSSASATARGLGAISEIESYKDQEKKDKDGNTIYKMNPDTGEFEKDENGNKIPEMERIYKYKHAKAAAMAAGTQEFLANKAVWESQWATMNNDMKKTFFQGKTNPDGSPLSTDDEKERQAFFEQYSNTLWQAQKSEMEATKASGDHIKKLAEERMSIDNIVGEKDTAEKILKALNKIVEMTKEEAEDSEERLILQRAGYNIDTETDESYEATRGQAAGMIEQRHATAQASYAAKVSQMSSGVPIGLQDMVNRGADGTITLSRFSGPDGGGLERSRTGQYVGSVVREGASGMADKYSSRELAHFMQYGAEAEEGLGPEIFKNFLSGNLGSNSADQNRKVAEIVRAAARKMTVGRPGNPENMAVLRGAVEGLRGAKNENGLGQILQSMNDYHKSKGGEFVDHVVDYSGLNHDQMADKILEKSKENKALPGVVYGVKNSFAAGFGGSESSHM